MKTNNKPLEQLRLFSDEAMESFIKEKPKKEKEKAERKALTDFDITVGAMREAMESGKYNGPETAEELTILFLNGNL